MSAKSLDKKISLMMRLKVNFQIFYDRQIHFSQRLITPLAICVHRFLRMAEVQRSARRNNILASHQVCLILASLGMTDNSIAFETIRY